MSIELAKKHTIELRFAVGDRVEVRDAEGTWVLGTIATTFHQAPCFGEGMCIPYSVNLDIGETGLVPSDDDQAVRLVARAKETDAQLVGHHVVISGLVSRPDLNGCLGKAIRFDEARGRYAVEIDAKSLEQLYPGRASESIMVKPGNVHRAAEGAKAAGTVISTRHAAAARLARPLPKACEAMPLMEREAVSRCYADYLRLCCALRDSRAASSEPAEADLPWTAFHLEVLLLLLGLKPAVLICHAASEVFVEELVGKVFQPWLEPTSPFAPGSNPAAPLLELRQITHACTPCSGCVYRGSWVLCAAKHAQRAEVDAAFFPSPTLRFDADNDPLLHGLIGRALGYPSTSPRGMSGDVDIAYVVGGLAHMEEVGDAAMLLDYEVAAPEELPGVLEHFLGCRKAVSGLLDIGFAMGGRVIETEALEALGRPGTSAQQVAAAFDEYAATINGLNQGDGVVL